MSFSLIKKLLLLSAFCLALEAFRVVRTGSLIYVFLPWNLFLAWIPLGFATAAAKEQIRWRFIALAAGWLLFFPNAPYLITDLMHLKPRNGFPLWYDCMLLYSFAFIGLTVGILSALIIYRKLREYLYARSATLIFFFLMLLSGYGVYMGRFLRWNSWDILLDPSGIVQDVVQSIAHPFAFPRACGMSLLGGTFLSLACWTFESFYRNERP